MYLLTLVGEGHSSLLLLLWLLLLWLLSLLLIIIINIIIMIYLNLDK